MSEWIYSILKHFLLVIPWVGKLLSEANETICYHILLKLHWFKTPYLFNFYYVENSKAFLTYAFWTMDTSGVLLCVHCILNVFLLLQTFFLLFSLWKGGNRGTHDQLALWGWIKLPCDPHRSHCRHPVTAVEEPLFEPAAGGLQHPLALKTSLLSSTRLVVHKV